MDCAIGLVGKDFVMLMTDMTVGRSIITYKHDEDKIHQLDATKLLATTGDYALRTLFADYVEKNLNLIRLKSDVDLSNAACAHFIRNQIATSLRSRNPVQCNCLLGGVDADGPALFYLDYFGSLQKLNFGAHGYCSNFCLSIMDKNYRTNMSQEEARQVLQLCLDTLNKRFLIHLPRFIIKTVTKDGIKEEIVEM